MNMIKNLWSWLCSWVVANEPVIEVAADKELNVLVERLIGLLEQHAIKAENDRLLPHEDTK
jgi:hypothetical protein